MKSLELISEKREGGANKHERHYLDFLISGLRLREILGITNYDLISPFGWGDNKEYERDLLKVLTLRKKSELDTISTFLKHSDVQVRANRLYIERT